VAQGLCYIDGERHDFGAALQPAVLALCDQDSLSAAALGAGLDDAQFMRQLVTWVNAGYWYFED
jgi:50S ribosomal protein L16 3-hydroxylase